MLVKTFFEFEPCFEVFGFIQTREAYRRAVDNKLIDPDEKITPYLLVWCLYVMVGGKDPVEAPQHQNVSILDTLAEILSDAKKLKDVDGVQFGAKVAVILEGKNTMTFGKRLPDYTFTIDKLRLWLFNAVLLGNFDEDKTIELIEDQN